MTSKTQFRADLTDVINATFYEKDKDKKARNDLDTPEPKIRRQRQLQQQKQNDGEFVDRFEEIMDKRAANLSFLDTHVLKNFSHPSKTLKGYFCIFKLPDSCSKPCCDPTIPPPPGLCCDGDVYKPIEECDPHRPPPPPPPPPPPVLPARTWGDPHYQVIRKNYPPNYINFILSYRYIIYLFIIIYIYIMSFPAKILTKMAVRSRRWMGSSIRSTVSASLSCCRRAISLAFRCTCATYPSSLPKASQPEPPLYVFSSIFHPIQLEPSNLLTQPCLFFLSLGCFAISAIEPN